MARSSGADDRLPLTRERIVGMALDLARSDGLAGASMRRIAGALGVEAMSLYHHVPSKAVLMVLMADRSVALMPAPDVSRPWDEQLVDLMQATFLAAVENPALFPVLSAEPLHPDALPASSPQMGAPTLGLLEQVLVLLEAGGVPQPLRVHVFRGLIGIVVGFVVGQVDGLLPTPTAADRTTSRRGGHPPTDQPPLLTQMRAALTAADPAEGLRCNLQLLLHGLKAQGAGSLVGATPLVST